MSIVFHLSSAHDRMDTRIYYKQCRSLLAAGHRVTLVVCDGKKNETINCINIVGFKKYSRRISRFLVSTFEILQFSIRNRADVYHLHDPELIPAGLVLRLLGRTVVFDAHEDLSLQILNKPYASHMILKFVSLAFIFFEKVFVKFLSGIIAATPEIERKYSRLNPQTVSVCNFPLLEEFPEVRSHSFKKNEICYVGGLARVRGVTEIISAMALVNGSPTLNLAGEFIDDGLRDEIVKNPGWQSVNELGFQNRSGVVEIYERSRVGLVTLHPLPNYLEALPVKMFEYMAAGLPVICSNFPLWVRIINDHKCGISVDPLDPSEIADAVSYLLDNPEVSREMGRNGRFAIENIFNWSNEAPKLVSFYDDLSVARSHI